VEIRRELRLVFVIVFAILFALTAAEAYVWTSLFSTPLREWLGWYDLVSAMSRAAEVAAMVVLLIAFYRHLLQPRAVPYRPFAGLAIALVGALLLLFPVPFQSTGNAVASFYVGATAASFFSVPMFLFGLGLMFLWGSPPEATPVFLPPQPTPRPVPPGSDEVATRPWSPP
jgi:hypothetical protein